jgi:6-phosphogluconolactonase/glucosamine-6-phosphate isomerase/deaminase
MLKRICLTGWWKIKFDEEDQGEHLGWPDHTPEDCRDINISSCWNEVFPDRFHYDGIAWYFKDLFFRSEDLDERILICFEGVNYRCDIYLNGQLTGKHEGGFTAFSVPIDQALKANALNRLAIKVDSRLDDNTLPPSGVDWFNYGGIYRPIYIETGKSAYLVDYTIKTRIDGTVSIISRLINSGLDGSFQLRAKIADVSGQGIVQDESEVTIKSGDVQDIRQDIQIPNPILWKLHDAYLYTLTLEVSDARGEVCDTRIKRFGVREFGVKGQKLLLNGAEIKLVGCAKHEDYPLTGRTVTREQLVKDYGMLRQMNANFVRLSHYPHNQLEHDILDELGMLAISEIPMVFLKEAQMTNPAILEKSKKMLAEMIGSEKNTTCIMFWSLFIECETQLPATREFVKVMVDATREMDDTRLVVMASNHPLSDVSYDLFDVVGVNYWAGWYEGETVDDGSKFLSAMAQKFPNKPLLITSHGWEGIYGESSRIEKTPWSEDLQSVYLSKIADVYMSYKNIVGEIIWTFADFRVSNWRDISSSDRSLAYLGRPVLVNHKGMVDYYRRPKTAYFAMRDKFAEWQQIVRPIGKKAGLNLNVNIYSNRRLLGEAAAFAFIDKVNELLIKKESIRVIFASAGSQIEFLETLLRNRMFVDWTRIHAYHLDEFVGADTETPFGFARWIKDHLIDQLPFKQFEALNGNAKDLAGECLRYGTLLAENEIDIACIGIGENGHLAFNDPPVANFEDPAIVKVIDLDEACREQQFRDGVFGDTASVPRQALTVTIPAIMRANTVLCIVPGTHKSVAVWKTLHNEISTVCPASILRRHPNATLYLDSESAALAYPNGRCL